jgi:hypothetical protein
MADNKGPSSLNEGAPWADEDDGLDEVEELGMELLDGEDYPQFPEGVPTWDGKIRPGNICVVGDPLLQPQPGFVWIDEARDIPQHVLDELGADRGPIGDYSNPSVND